MQQKWVELFEKVIGRKPTPAEFMAGKESGFDLKQIQSIAGKDLEATQVFSAQEVAEPVVEEETIDPLLAARQAWLAHFEETYGRKPSPDEFAAAKSQNFEYVTAPAAEQEVYTDYAQETQEYTTPQPTPSFITAESVPVSPKKQKAPKTKSGKKLSKKKIWIISAVSVLVIALVAAFMYFRSTTSVE
ncbi:MAG: hypothetical protein E6259_03015, partial [Streptococcus sp.]|nr:hypothetical protein [Streptococcus sp.]